MTISKRSRILVGLTAACACIAVLGAVLGWAASPASRFGLPLSRSDTMPAASDEERDSQSAEEWYAIEGATLTTQIDEASVMHAEVHNYPVFGSSGVRSLNDVAAMENLLGLVNGKTFSAAQSVHAWNESRKDYVGGYSSSVVFFDEDGSCCGNVQFDPGFPGDGVAIIAHDTIYCMDGDQSALIDALDEQVTRLRDEQPPQETGR